MKIVIDNFNGGLNTYDSDDGLDSTEGKRVHDCAVGTKSLHPLPDVGAGVPPSVILQKQLEDRGKYIEYDGKIYTSAEGPLKILDGRDLGLERPKKSNMIIKQVNTPGTSGHLSGVTGPSEDGSGNFDAQGSWIPTEYPQTNTWVFTDADLGVSTTTLDSWIICDNPNFNLTEYYSLLFGNPSIKSAPPTRDEFGCVDNVQSCSSASIDPSDTFLPEYLTEDTTYAISWWNEETETESTISEAIEFEHKPVIKTRCWSYGPTEGNITGAESFVNILPIPQNLRGDGKKSETFTGTSHLHQVSIKVVGGARNASHAIIYQRVRGEFIPIAKVGAGFETIVTAQTEFSPEATKKNFAQERIFKTPPANLENLFLTEAGVMGGSIANTVFLSEPFKFDLFSTDYEFKLKHTPVSIHPFYNEIFITTKGNPTRLVGQLPERMTVIEMPDMEANLAMMSATDMGRRIVWAGPEGVSIFNGSETRVVSRAKLSRSDWKAIIASPTSLVGIGTEELYLLFYATGSLMVDLRPESAAITTLSLTATQAVYDMETATIYLNNGRTWKPSDPNPEKNASGFGFWDSGRVNTKDHTKTLGWARVQASGPVELTITNDLNDNLSVKPSDNQPFRIGSGGGPLRGSWYYLNAKFKHRIRSIELATDVEEFRVG